MYFIVGFGLLMMYFSIIMIIRPNYWSNGIILFSEKPYFHWFEVISRLFSGILFVYFHKSALYPSLLLAMGYLLIAVGLGLLIVGPAKHRKFAVWSALTFKHIFRPAGACSFIFGVFLIYVSKIGIVGS